MVIAVGLVLHFAYYDLSGWEAPRTSLNSISAALLTSFIAHTYRPGDPSEYMYWQIPLYGRSSSSEATKARGCMITLGRPILHDQRFQRSHTVGVAIGKIGSNITYHSDNSPDTGVLCRHPFENIDHAQVIHIFTFKCGWMVDVWSEEQWNAVGGVENESRYHGNGCPLSGGMLKTKELCSEAGRTVIHLSPVRRL